MKYGARPLILLAALIACRPSTQTPAERAAAAARADSSAAGYEVGPLSNSAARPQSIRDSVASTVASSGKTSGSEKSTTNAPHAPQPDTVKQAGSTSGTGTVAVNGQGSRGSGGSTGSGSPTGTSMGRDSGVIAGTPPLDPALEPNYIAYDTARKTVTFQLAAGDEIREQVSFNGVQRGGRTFTVPLGWRVTIAFANRDPELPHSATIVDVSGSVPEELPAPIFPRANTVRTSEGLLEGDADEILFTADRVGRYLIACGVLGHAQRGQWITLDVSTTATTPTYR